MAVLDNITTEVLNSTINYFNILSAVGYKSYKDVDKLLVFSFIQKLLTECKDLITEEDYNSLSNIVTSFYGTCMIPFPLFTCSSLESEMLPVIYDDYIRVTEDTEVRITDQNELRLSI